MRTVIIVILLLAVALATAASFVVQAGAAESGTLEQACVPAASCQR